VDNLTKERLFGDTDPLIATDDWRAVRDLWQPYVDSGDVDAQAYLAYLILQCLDAPKIVDVQMGKQLRAAAERGHANAMYWLSQSMNEGIERDKLLLEAGQLGSQGAQRDLGALFATGDWTGPKDAAQAIHWYRLAAERGHEDAQYNLGFMYLLGEGTTQDVGEGMLWLLRSAEQGDSAAMRLLADCYRNGHYGIARSEQNAELWERSYQADHKRIATTARLLA
jgi:TPR repeat protein